MADLPKGKQLRQYILDPVLYSGKEVVWRNHEASYDVMELEPASRKRSTYVLQEYFIPVSRFNDFYPRMTAILRLHHVNAMNISIRHSRQDTGTLLAWAKTEVFAFVLYYKQKTDRAAKAEVGNWTREIIDAALECNGSYYLPYQIYATNDQFLKAYPHAPDFFPLKKLLDPTNKFRNKLWDAYYRNTE